MNRNGALQRFFITAIPVLIFVDASMKNLRLPGIQYDEVYYVPPAAALLKNQPDADYVKLDPSVIHLFEKPLPLMFNYYTSFFRTYLTLPVFAAFGISVYSIRATSIALGVVAMVFFIAFARRLVRNSSVALATGLLLALDASFVAYLRNDFAVVATMMALKGIVLWALLRWWQEGNPKHLYLGSFFLGLGITDRASFLWIPMAMAPAIFLAYRGNVIREIRRRRGSVKKALVACLCFAAGASVFIAFNIATRGGTFMPMLDSFGKTAGGANNFAFFENFHLRLQMLTEILGGNYFSHFIAGDATYQTNGWDFSGSPISWLMPLAFIYFALRLLALLFREKIRKDLVSEGLQPLLFLMLMTLFLLVLTCFTPTLFRGHQLLMLYPFPHLLVALFVFDGVELLLHKLKVTSAGFLNFFAILIIVGIVAVAVRPVFAYHRMLEQTGGRGAWSDAIYDIVAEVDRHPENTVVCMDWGFNANILALTKNPVKTIRNYYIDTRRQPEQLAGLFDERHTFLFHAPAYTLMPEPRDDFTRAVAVSNARVDTLRVFYQRDGRAVAVLVSARRQQ